MNMSWDDVQLFLAIAETGSLSAAAKQLRLGQPTVSRRLARVEYDLGYQLFRRQADGVALTTAAERLLVPARKMAEWAGEVGRAASASDRSPSGVVRVAAAPGVAWDFLAGFAAWMRQKYRQIRVEALCSIQYLDLARGEADIALRSRPPASEDLKLVATLTHRNGVFASREYAAKLKKGYGFADVDWVCWAPPYEDVPPNPQLRALIPGFTPSFTSDNFLVQWRAAEAGLGAFINGDVPHRFAPPTNLVPLKLDLGPFQTASLYMVAAKSALDIPRVRDVADLLSAELARVSLPSGK